MHAEGFKPVVRAIIEHLVTPLVVLLSSSAARAQVVDHQFQR